MYTTERNDPPVPTNGLFCGGTHDQEPPDGRPEPP